MIIELLVASWTVLAQMSPFLLLGFLISGILSVLISVTWVEKHLGRSGSGSVVKATLLGIPLPLCSCGVIPVAASLRKSGANKGATTAFLLSTPQTGVDCFMATYGLLGPLFAVFRPLSALVTGVLGGLTVAWADPDKLEKSTVANKGSDSKKNVSQSFATKVSQVFKYGFVTLPSEIYKALFIGVIIAGFMSTFLEGTFLNEWFSNYYLSFVIMLFIGMPLYVCSTSSIPVALGFIRMGVSPGAALVFLISGPATNAAAVTVLWKLLGRKATVIYILTMIVGSVGAGLVFDALNETFSESVLEQIACHSELKTWEHGSAILMLVIMFYAFYRSQIKKQNCLSCSSKALELPDIVIEIVGMSCQNCANAVEKAIKEVAGVDDVSVSLKDKCANIYGDKLDGSELIKAVEDLGYTSEIKK